MPTESFVTPSEVERVVGYSDDATSEIDLQSFIEEAHREMTMKVGRFVDERVVTNLVNESGDLRTDYKLDFQPLLKVERVVLYGDMIVDESNYTIDKQDGTISFDQSYVNDNFQMEGSFTVRHQPKVLRDLELWWTVSILKNQNMIQVEDDQVKAQVEKAEQKVKRLSQYFNRFQSTGKVTDGNVNRFTP